MKQQALKNYIDISGIPYTKEEIKIAIVKIITRKIGLEISASDISSCYRIGQNTGVNVKGEPLPPVIVVEFLRETTKIAVINSMKKRTTDLTSRDLGFKDSPSSKIYINERLTPYFRDVKREALKLKINKSLTFVWTNGGVVHGRVGLATPILSFDSIEDIHIKLSMNPQEKMETGLDINPRKLCLRSAKASKVDPPSTSSNGNDRKVKTKRKRKTPDTSKPKKRGPGRPPKDSKDSPENHSSSATSSNSSPDPDMTTPRNTKTSPTSAEMIAPSTT